MLFLVVFLTLFECTLLSAFSLYYILPFWCKKDKTHCLHFFLWPVIRENQKVDGIIFCKWKVKFFRRGRKNLKIFPFSGHLFSFLTENLVYGKIKFSSHLDRKCKFPPAQRFPSRAWWKIVYTTREVKKNASKYMFVTLGSVSGLNSHVLWDILTLPPLLCNVLLIFHFF